MVLKNVHTGRICSEKELIISWEMDTTYDSLNWEGDEEDNEMQSFADWLREQVEEGEYEVVEG